MWEGRLAWQILANRGLRNFDSQFEQLALDAADRTTAGWPYSSVESGLESQRLRLVYSVESEKSIVLSWAVVPNENSIRFFQGCFPLLCNNVTSLLSCLRRLTHHRGFNLGCC